MSLVRPLAQLAFSWPAMGSSRPRDGVRAARMPDAVTSAMRIARAGAQAPQKKEERPRTDRSSVTSADGLRHDLERQGGPRPGSLARVVERAVGADRVDREAVGAVAG